MNTIKLEQLPSWNQLTEGERTWAKYVALLLEATGRVAKWQPSCCNQIEYSPAVDERKDYIKLWACDSILCALTHSETKIAFRALLQATGYLASLEEMGTDLALACLRDACKTAQVRIEDRLK